MQRWLNGDQLASIYVERIVLYMKWIRKFVKRLDLNKQKVISVAFAIGFTMMVFVDTNYLDHTLLSTAYIFSLTLIAVVLLAVMLLAGFAVYKAVIHASVGFGVIIFMAKTYCDLPSTTPEGIEALTALWTIGLVYIFYEFGNKLQEAYKIHTDKIKKDEKKAWEQKVLVIIYLVFVVMYLSLIAQVLTPIALDLCIYK